MMKDVTVSARIPAELEQQIDTLATATRRSRSWVIEEALRAYVNTELQFLEAVEEGIQGMEAGEVVSHFEVVNAIRSKRKPL